MMQLWEESYSLTFSQKDKETSHDDPSKNSWYRKRTKDTNTNHAVHLCYAKYEKYLTKNVKNRLVNELTGYCICNNIAR